MPTAETHEKQFTGWWEAHRGIFLKIARSFTASAADEADLVQEMLVQLWRSLPRFQEQCSPSTWIYRICLNTALSWRRGEQRRTQPLEPPLLIHSEACPIPSPAAAHARQDDFGALYGAIRRLPATERSLVLLLLDDLSYREISSITGLTENHIGVALTRARRRLAEALQEELR